MHPLTNNDDDLLVYCDWLEDEGRSEESMELREEIINPNVGVWQWEVSSWEGVGFDGTIGEVGCNGKTSVGGGFEEVGGTGFKGVGSSTRVTGGVGGRG